MHESAISVDRRFVFFLPNLSVLSFLNFGNLKNGMVVRSSCQFRLLFYSKIKLLVKLKSLENDKSLENFAKISDKSWKDFVHRWIQLIISRIL